jgi:hypothetical protein
MTILLVYLVSLFLFSKEKLVNSVEAYKSSSHYGYIILHVLCSLMFQGTLRRARILPRTLPINKIRFQQRV